MKQTWFVLFLGCATLLAQPESFELRTGTTSPYTRTYIGNGYFSLATSVLGTDPEESFMARVYDHAPGDIPHLAALPAWNELDVFDGRSWLNQASGQSLQSYEQSLDMYDGTVRTRYRWVDGGRTASIDVQAFVSRLNPNLAGVRLRFTPQFSGPVRVAFSLRGWKPPKRFALARLEKLPPGVGQQEIWYPGYMVVQEHRAAVTRAEGLLQMTSHPDGVKLTVAEAAALAWPAGLRHLAARDRSAAGRAVVEVSFEAAAGTPYTFYKYVAAVPSLDAADPLAKAVELARSARSRGYDAVLRESSDEWHRLWQTDIVAGSAPDLQKVIHSMLFYLLASARAGADYSIPPMGLSTGGYYGHVFWDADTFMFPPLMVLHPEMAKSIVTFREKTLKAAEENARRNGYQGAMYPWEAGPDGEETTPRFAYQNATSEVHVNGDVALAQWQYYLATGDRQWLAHYGYPVIRETANFWVSRVTWVPQQDRYEIRDVVSVVESLIGIPNDPYTNAVARKNLELADAAARVLGEAPNPEWRKVAGKLYVPPGAFVLRDYPLEERLTAAEKRKALEEALADFRARKFSVMMGVEFDPILAAEVHDRGLLDAVLPCTYEPYLLGPFNVLREVPDNRNINFLTGAGGFLQQFVFGYTGLRFADSGLTRRYQPLLPSRIRSLKLTNVSIRGARRDIAIGQ